MSGRILGLDFGAKTVGVAVSDPLGITAQGLEIVRRTSEKKLRRTMARLEEIIREYDVQQIVVGHPLNMNGTEGERAEKSAAFCEALQRRTGLPAELWDERLTTVEAERAMDAMEISRDKRKEIVDEIAAVLILQNYLDARSRT